MDSSATGMTLRRHRVAAMSEVSPTSFINDEWRTAPSPQWQNATSGVHGKSYAMSELWRGKRKGNTPRLVALPPAHSHSAARGERTSTQLPVRGLRSRKKLFRRRGELSVASS
ncbi:unnamed protein product, partial [Iphiclides podalirius]